MVDVNLTRTIITLNANGIKTRDVREEERSNYTWSNRNSFLI